MFKVQVSETIWCKVEIPIKADNGAEEKRVYYAEFTRLSREQLRAVSNNMLYRRLDDEELDELVKKGTLTEAELAALKAEPPLTDEEVVRRYLVGWKEVADHEGQPLPFNEHTRDQLMSIWPTMPCTVNAFFLAHEAPELKNSRTLRGIGRK
ncbi:MAG: hypothetical protein LBI35_07240 [Burkholderiales bacterium]|jgi:hypothetical protein|nr:hypothetical protein [Burkholderiales bacterium]